MTIKKRFIYFSWGLVLACASIEEPPQTRQEEVCVEPQALAAKAPRGLLDPAVAPSFGPPGPIKSTFARTYPKGLYLDHGITPCTVGSGRPYPNTISAIGWSADSTSFGFCALEDGSGAFVCELAGLDGKVKREDDIVDGEPEEQKTSALYKKAERYGYAADEWPYTDLKIVYESQLDTSDPEKPLRQIRVGALYQAEETPAYVLTLRANFHDPNEWPDEIALSPDGEYLGVSANFQSKIIPTHVFAGKVYNTIAYRLHQRGEYAQAATLFHRAAYADPSSKVAMYNLACALARLDDPGAPVALSLAIQRHGEVIKEKARKDKDFDGVRARPWFQSLVEPSPH